MKTHSMRHVRRCPGPWLMWNDVGGSGRRGILGGRAFGIQYPREAISATAGSYQEPVWGPSERTPRVRDGASEFTVHTQCAQCTRAKVSVFGAERMSRATLPLGRPNARDMPRHRARRGRACGAAGLAAGWAAGRGARAARAVQWCMRAHACAGGCAQARARGGGLRQTWRAWCGGQSGRGGGAGAGGEKS